MTRQVAICNSFVRPKIKNGYSLQSFSINETQLPCGVIETHKMDFDASEKENLDKVFVRKKGFSCNYRDKSIALSMQSILDKYGLKKSPKFYALGSEFSGEVVAVGNQVKQFKVGDRVISNGNYPSEYPELRHGLPTNNGSKEYDAFHFSKLIKIPKTMSWEVASCFQIGAQTSYSMIRKLDVKAGQKILITGATSNTSLFAINALKQYDVEIFALTTRDTFKQNLLDLGVKEVFVIDLQKPLYHNPIIGEYVKQHGIFDVAIDPFCDLYCDRVVDLIGMNGKYVSCGLYDQHPSMTAMNGIPNNLKETLTKVFLKNISLIGNCLGSTKDLQNAIDDYEQGKLEVVIDSVYTDDQTKDFFDRSFNSKDRFGKVVYSYI